MDDTFSTEQMISFGNYLLSDDRKYSFEKNPNFPNRELLLERLAGVTHADFMNWFDKQ